MTKKALGKGLASLLGGGSVEENSAEEIKKAPPISSSSNLLGKTDSLKINLEGVKTLSTSTPSGSIGPLMVDVSKIKENPYQPRKHFKDEELLSLGQSIKANGIIQPLVVTKKDDHYELIAGERRLRASRLVGISQVPVIIKQATDRDRLIMAIIENVQRSDLNCVEEAYGYFKLMDEFHLTQEEVSAKVGKERSTVANFLRILKLPRKVIEYLQKELLSFGHAKILASMKDTQQITKIADEVVQNNLSIRELESYLKELEMKKEVTPEMIKERSQSDRIDPKDTFRLAIEKRTGFHIKLKSKSDGSGQIAINFNDAEEFNKIYDFFMKN